MDIRRATICRDCLAVFRQTKRLRIAASISRRSRTFNANPPLSQHHSHAQSAKSVLPQNIHRLASESSSPGRTQPQHLDLNALHHRVLELAGSILKHDQSEVPSEQRILYVLEQLQFIAKAILDERGPDGVLKHTVNAFSSQETATSALLGSVNARQYSAPISKASVLSVVGEKAEEIVRHHHVFISSGVLKAYVELQASLQQPTSFPDIFTLYASKPVPRLKSNNVEYTFHSSDKINAAIDPKTANIALTAAIQAHNLSLAIDIITTSFSTPAFRKAKFLRQAAFPISGLVVAPFAAYTLSGALSSLQQTMDPSTATGIAFAGIMTYVGAVSMVGYVAVTTANDQMERVTWASGVPLWERWIREEERAAIDRVAGAWGFRDLERRGEEEGEEWESLREWVGMRGMILDRVSLMEGME